MSVGVITTSLFVSLVVLREAVKASRSKVIARRLFGAGDRSSGVYLLAQRDSRHRTSRHSAVTLPSFLHVPPWVVLAMRRGGMSIDPSLVWTRWMLFTTGAALVALIGYGVVPAVLVSLCAIGAPSLLLWALRDRLNNRLVAGLPVFLESIARSMRSGASLRQALEESVSSIGEPINDDLRGIVAEIAAGVPISAALERWAIKRPLPGVRLAVASLLLGAETGGAHARALDGIAATLRGELGLSAEVKALSSQARTSALVMATAPLAFAVFTTITDGATASFLFGTPAGWACLVAGLTLDAIAALWMQHLAKVTW